LTTRRVRAHGEERRERGEGIQHYSSLARLFSAGPGPGGAGTPSW
jgi:hypothetical protein